MNFNAGYEIAGEMVHKMNKTEKMAMGIIWPALGAFVILPVYL